MIPYEAQLLINAASGNATGNRSKRVWCVRHAQAEHNELFEKGLTKEGRELRDPKLSQLGVEQARALLERSGLFRAAVCSPKPEDRAALLVSSPCWRALQTATEALAPLRERGEAHLRIVAHPDLQECGEYPCDTGQALSVLVQGFPEVDFSLLAHMPTSWFQKPGVRNGGEAMLQRRCEAFTRWLQARPEARIIVVGHSTLFAWLLQVDFANCEVMEMRLQPPAPEPSVPWPMPMAPTNLGPAHEGAFWSQAWEVAQADGSARVVPLFSSKGTRITMHGSPPLRGTLETCRKVRGERSAKATADRAGMLLLPCDVDLAY